VRLFPVHPDQLQEELRRVRPFLEAALEHQSDIHIAGVENDLMLRDAQLWVGERSAAVTQVCAWPQRRTFHIFLAGGDMEELLGILEGAEPWARAMCCTAVTVRGRKGWARVLQDKGYSVVAYELERGL
jgi:hypothetical protein